MSEVAETAATIAGTITTTQSEEVIRSQQSGELQNIQAAYKLDGKNLSQMVSTRSHCA